MDTRKLIEGYEKSLQHLSEFLRGAEKTAEDNIDIALASAKEQLHELKGFTEEEITLIQNYLKRDVSHLGKQSQENYSEVGEWFRFDLKLLESRIWENLIKAADPTWLELNKLKENSFYFIYKTGELVGPSSLECKHCGKTHHFYKVSHIPPCSGCKSTEFTRIE